MYKALALSPFQFSSGVKNKKHISSLSNHQLLIAYILIGLNVLLLGWYLVGVNSYAYQGYEMKKIQTNIDRLSDENEKLVLKVSEQSSLSVLRSDFSNSEYVAIGQPKFLQLSPANQFSER